MDPALSGLILDTSVLITGERGGKSIIELLKQIRGAFGEIEIGLSVITVAEIAHGVRRAKTEEQRRRRERFLEEILDFGAAIYRIDTEHALLAGVLGGDLAQTGAIVALEDLLIGVTALKLGFGVLTENIRHFRQIPGVDVRVLS